MALTHPWLPVAVALLTAAGLAAAPVARKAPVTLTLKSSAEHRGFPPIMNASYLKPSGLEMVRLNAYSADNGVTWETWSDNPQFDKDLPHGYRRENFPLFVDHSQGWIVRLVPSMDTPGLDPNIVEPPVSLETYYLRYRVSLDGGRTYLFDEQIIQEGHTPENPFDGVYHGRNGIFMGDVGSQMLRTHAGRIIVPAQACKLGPDGKLHNPGGGWTYTNVIMIIGTWTEGHRLQWEIAEPIEGDPERSTRGMIEPTVAEMPDGTLLCVMRGSNESMNYPEARLPSYRWFSLSRDGGFHWTKPEPWTYDSGKPFFSPSSMSQLLPHSNGRVFWIGNINAENSHGNERRYPLYIGEVDLQTFGLIESTLLLIDTKRPDEENVYLSHWWGLEDRATGDIVIGGARYGPGYKSRKPWLWRIGLDDAEAR